jgi:hypothetical protein
MPEPRKFLPPTSEDRKIVREVAERIGGPGAVTLYGIEKPNDQLAYGLILEYGQERKVIEREYPFLDVMEIANLYEQWRDTRLYQAHESRWSTVPQ